MAQPMKRQLRYDRDITSRNSKKTAEGHSRRCIRQKFSEKLVVVKFIDRIVQDPETKVESKIKLPLARRHEYVEYLHVNKGWKKRRIS